ELLDYGLDLSRVHHPDQYQLRIVKAADRAGQSVLQGIIVVDVPGATPMRTREIAMTAGGTIGFADGRDTIGAFGTWGAPRHIWAATFRENSLVDLTGTIVSGRDFLRRIASDGIYDAAMRSNLFMGGHNINNIRNIVSESAKFMETIHSQSIEVSRTTFDARITLDGNINITGDMSVMGPLTSESRGIEARLMTISGTSRFNSVNTSGLWVGDLNISGFSVPWSEDIPTIITIGRMLDMTHGRINANRISVGFGGSVSPRLVVRGTITDTSNPAYFWDTATGNARMQDIRIPDLSLMMRAAVAQNARDTDSARQMTAPANNANATVADFERALREIERRVRAKHESVTSNQ
ncbi:MAG: shufflon system plasmid conjugative transfer pilus tip adhesin PilV, partial [Alphaproteobacteria bacterium]|nr:shufflon system plasmid conjugative transfer pilus tip adhesin PilV [Alphaproteobacteria bacterium]